MPAAPASQFAGPSRSSSTAPNATLLLSRELSRSRTMSTSAAQPTDLSPPSRRSTFDQPSSSQSFSRAAQRLGPRTPTPPSIFDEPNGLGSLSNVSSHSMPDNAREIQNGEGVLVEAPIQSYSFHDMNSQVSHGREGYLEIFELHGRFDMPTRRVAVRSCGPGEHCVSHCRTLWILNTP